VSRWVLVCLCFASAGVAGQQAVWCDTIRLFPLQGFCGHDSGFVRLRLDHSLDYALTCSNLWFSNWKQGDNTGTINLFQNVTYRTRIACRTRLAVSTMLTHDLGLRYLFDSIADFEPDNTILDTRIDLRLNKLLTFSFVSNISSRLFNAYGYESDSNGAPVKRLKSAFLTPLTVTFSAGFGLKYDPRSTVTLGISAARFTLVRNRSVYCSGRLLSYHGVPVTKTHLIEYGLSMHFMADRLVMKHVKWNCDLLVFKNFNKPADFSFRNQFAVAIGKYLKVTIRSRLLYNQEVSLQLQMENMVAFGLMLQL
jgi:hypothetical protein